VRDWQNQTRNKRGIWTSFGRRVAMGKQVAGLHLRKNTVLDGRGKWPMILGGVIDLKTTFSN